MRDTVTQQLWCGSRTNALIVDMCEPHIQGVYRLYGGGQSECPCTAAPECPSLHSGTRVSLHSGISTPDCPCTAAPAHCPPNLSPHTHTAQHCHSSNLLPTSTITAPHSHFYPHTRLRHGHVVSAQSAQDQWWILQLRLHRELRHSPGCRSYLYRGRSPGVHRSRQDRQGLTGQGEVIGQGTGCYQPGARSLRQIHG